MFLTKETLELFREQNLKTVKNKSMMDLLRILAKKFMLVQVSNEILT